MEHLALYYNLRLAKKYVLVIEIYLVYEKCNARHKSDDATDNVGSMIRKSFNCNDKSKANII